MWATSRTDKLISLNILQRKLTQITTDVGNALQSSACIPDTSVKSVHSHTKILLEE
jgi:hypothetical protein